MFSLLAATPADTMEIGRRLGLLLAPGDFINLNGELGAGKTLLVKGLGQSLNIPPAEITSPTFTIINEYEGTHLLYHLDLYRLAEDYELEQIGYLDYFYGPGITAVEWGDLFAAYLPADRLDIVLETMEGGTRKISFNGLGRRSLEIAEKLRGQS